MAFYKAGKELADLHLNYEQGINEQITGQDGDYPFYANMPMLAHRAFGIRVIGDTDIWQGDVEADAAVFARRIDALRRERKERSMALQRRVFEKFDFLNARGEVRNVCAIFEDERHELPPAGAGECAAPRLLYGYRPLAMGEFWLGESPEGAIRKHGQFYPSCKSKCEPILKFMLQRLDVEASPLENGRMKPINTSPWIR